ncbi:MAG: hypothetical protein ACK46X_08475 [Candidatus Sericytochromatia bacterium]
MRPVITFSLLGALMLAPAAVSVLAAAPAQAEAGATLAGAYALNAAASDDVNKAIDKAVAQMNFVMRPIAHSRLRGTNEVYKQVKIDLSGQTVSTTFDKRAAIVTPASGAAIKWAREDGEKFDVSTAVAGGKKLTQTFKGTDGQRVNVFTLSPDGGKLTMNVTITSPKLSAPLTYKLVFNRQ